jgi:hypothetical protein
MRYSTACPRDVKYIKTVVSWMLRHVFPVDVHRRFGMNITSIFKVEALTRGAAIPACCWCVQFVDKYRIVV